MSFSFINRVFKNIPKINIHKPLTHQTQLQIIHLLNAIKKYNSPALIVVINSFGGSLPIAKNISNSIINIKNQKKIPIFCFAEDFCLNSANLILTSGTYAYTNKFTVLGDFGFVYQNFNTKEASKRFNLGKQVISSQLNSQNCIEFRNSIFKHNQNKIYNWLYTAQYDLRVEIMRNRFKHLKASGITEKDFQNNIFNIGFLDPKNAKQYGLIDDIKNFNQILKTNYKGIKLSQPQQSWEIKLMNKIWQKTNPLTD